MAFRVHIENFQSIVEADLEVSGLTTITGQNNAGKSAIVRALRGVFTNPGNGSSYVHHGKDHFQVRIDFDDGKYIVWERFGRRATKGKKKGKLIDIKTNYEVNGVRYEGVANSVPDEVLKQGIGPISIGRDQVWPQMAKQVKDVFFLVDRPGSHIAEAVANVDDVAILNIAMRECDKELRTVKSDLRLRRQDANAHKDKLEAMSGLDEVAEQVKGVEALHTHVTRIQKGISTASEMRGRLTKAQSEVNRLAPILDVQVPESKKVSALKSILREVKEARELQARYKSAQNTLKRYGGAHKLAVPESDRTLALRELLEELREAQNLKRHREAAQAAASRLAPSDALTELDLDKGLLTLKKVAKGLQVYGDLKERLHKARDQASVWKTKMVSGKKQVAEAQAELDDFMKTHPKCPECGQFRIGHREAS